MSIASQQTIVEDAAPGAAGRQQFLTFSLNDEVYGICILHIHEIIEYGDLTVVPLMPDFISGVINLRGSVVPVISLARRFNQQPREIDKRSSIIIVEVKAADDCTAEAGIIVDNVNEVIDLGADEIAPAPAFGARIRTDFIQGMGRVNDQLMILLDINHVLSISEISAIVGLNGNPDDSPGRSNGQQSGDQHDETRETE